jgi:cysteine-rich repeat protein
MIGGRALRPLALGIALLAARGARAECDLALLCGAADDPCTVHGTHELDAGCTLDFGTRAVVVTGTLKSAVDGGSFAIRSGAFTLDGGALRAHGPSGAAGGIITITATGPFVLEPSGPIVEADGANGGGIVNVVASAIDLRAGTITVDGTAGAATGGAVLLTATGAVTIDATLSAQGRGSADSGGGIVNVTGASLVVRGTINTAGGSDDGGPIDLTATAGDLTIDATALLLARAGNAEASGGLGGGIDLDATGSVHIAGPVRSEGPGPDGTGGDVTIAADGSVRIDDAITTEGTGAESDAGDLTIDAGTFIAFGANVNAEAIGGDGGGGTIDVEAVEDVTIADGVTLRSSGGSSGAGDVLLTSRSAVHVAGAIDATARNGAPGGNVAIEGCSITIDGTLDASATGGGTAGANSFTAATFVLGPSASLLATPPLAPPEGFTSTNALRLRTDMPSIAGTATIDPDLQTHLDPSLTTCCGNGTLDSGELCDDGNRRACDGCDATCAPEAPCPPDGNPCTLDCDPNEGCVYTAQSGTPCPGDGDVCTTDVCVGGACMHPPTTCDDGVVCTIDACDPATGCTATPSDALCDDGNDCTVDTCNPVSGCASVVRPDFAPCDDGNVCTTDDACLLGQCVGTGIPLACDDGSPCTVDSCDPHFGCVNLEDPAACPCVVGGTPKPAGTPCVDGNGCTTPDTCDGSGHCIGGPVCDDGDPCTSDACFFLCVHVDDRCTTDCAGRPDGTPCSDHAVCTVGACHGGVCVSTPRDCGDEDPCKGADLCVEPTGCRRSYPPASDPRCFNTPLDAFGCYKARGAGGTPPFAPVAALAATASFDALAMDVRRAQDVCVPASYAGGDPLAPFHDDTLDAYKVTVARTTPRFTRVRSVAVQNTIGTHVLDLVARDRLLVPAALSLGSPPGEPAPPNPDAFFCYKAATSSGTARFTPIPDVAVADLFGTLHLQLAKLTRLCAPVDLAGEDPTAPAHSTVLVCYKAKPIVPKSFLARVVSVNDRFPAQTLYLTKPDEICLPSLRLALPPP